MNIILFQRDLPRLHQFGKKVLPGIFLRSELIAEGFSKGDILIVDLEDLEKLDTSEIHLRRINAKETQKENEFMFRVPDGKAKLSGSDYEFREPTPRRKESQPAETTDDAEAPCRPELHP